MSDNKNIRIKDIARMAGVSVGTVDRVIHKRGKVSDDVQKKIEDVLQNTGYKPNLLASTLGSNKTLRIAVVTPNPEQDEYWAMSKSGIEQSKVTWSQYSIELSAYHFDLYDSTSFAKVAQSVLDFNPDGVLAAPIFHDESLDLFGQLSDKSIPYILFNTNLTETKPLSFIGQNLCQSGKVAGEVLDYCVPKGKIIAILHIQERVENSVHLMAKETGFRNFIDGNYPIQSFDLNNLNDLESRLSQILELPDLGGIYASTSKGTHIIASAIEKYNKLAIKLVGYDLLTKNIEFLQKGVINFLINQNPKRMTQLGISHLTNYLLFKKELTKEELFPLEIITHQNLSSYLESGIE